MQIDVQTGEIYENGSGALAIPDPQAIVVAGDDLVELSDHVLELVLAQLEQENDLATLKETHVKVSVLEDYLTAKLHGHAGLFKSQNNMGQARLRVERELGRKIIDWQERGLLASRGGNGSNQHKQNLPDGSFAPTLKDYAITYKQSSLWQDNARTPKEILDAYCDQAEASATFELTSTGYRRICKQFFKKQYRIDTAKLAVVLDSTNAKIIHADFRDFLKTLPDNSVDLIFTDPPYDAESIPLYEALAKEAARVLMPGGSLLAYAGHYALPQIMQSMGAHLRYWWLIALSHQSGNHRRLEGKKVYVTWKPVLWYVKESYYGLRAVADLMATEQPDKKLHAWEQDISIAKYYIDYLTKPGALVVDPMCGAGTICKAALTTGRRTIGVEIDSERALVAKANLNGL